GLDVQRDASEKFRTGQHQVALEMLSEYLNDLAEQKLDARDMALLRRPIDARISQFRLMAAQKEMADGRMAASNAAADRVAKSRQAEDVKRKNVERLMREFNPQFKEGKYLEAESTAMKASELDPDNGVATAAVYMARRQRAVVDFRDIKERREG